MLDLVNLCCSGLLQFYHWICSVPVGHCSFSKSFIDVVGYYRSFYMQMASVISFQSCRKTVSLYQVIVSEILGYQPQRITVAEMNRCCSCNFMVAYLAVVDLCVYSRLFQLGFHSRLLQVINAMGHHSFILMLLLQYVTMVLLYPQYGHYCIRSLWRQRAIAAIMDPYRDTRSI